jgi:hypothetical protein
MGRFGPVRRIPLADVVHEDRWNQPTAPTIGELDGSELQLDHHRSAKPRRVCDVG